MPRKFNKVNTETEYEVRIDSGCENSFTNSCVQNSPENRLSIVSERKERKSVQDLVTETNSEAVRGGVVPRTSKYITAGGKQALMLLLQSAAALIPVPLLQEEIGVALKIIVEAAKGIERNIKDLLR